VLYIGRGADMSPLCNYDSVQVKVYEPEQAA
jgi:hypothetical protein